MLDYFHDELCNKGHAHPQHRLQRQYTLVNIKKLLILKRRIGILKKLPKQGEDSESL